MRRTILTLVLALALAASASAATPRASLTDIESQVMCTLCHEPLNEADSPQAQSERDYIRGLIAAGETKSQILANLVAQYGESVLGRPPARGFNLTVYILPPALVVLGLGFLAVSLPRWRRRSRAASAAVNTALAGGPALDPRDARRLDEDLARFD